MNYVLERIFFFNYNIPQIVTFIYHLGEINLYLRKKLCVVKYVNKQSLKKKRLKTKVNDWKNIAYKKIEKMKKENREALDEMKNEKMLGLTIFL